MIMIIGRAAMPLSMLVLASRSGCMLFDLVYTYRGIPANDGLHPRPLGKPLSGTGARTFVVNTDVNEGPVQTGGVDP